VIEQNRSQRGLTRDKDCWTGTCTSLWPEWIAYLKDWQSKKLIVWVWEHNDFLIPMPNAEIVKQVVPAARRYFGAGHFVLDEFADTIAGAIIETFSR
jgi:hypothetical protein